MKKTILSLTIIVLLLSASFGIFALYQYSMQSKRWYKSLLGAKPTADEILANYYKVTGEGSQAEQSSMKIKGTMTMGPKDPMAMDNFGWNKASTQMGPIEMELTAKFPDKFRMEAKTTITINALNRNYQRTSTSANIQFTQAYDGQQGWKTEMTRREHRPSFSIRERSKN